MYDNHSLDLSVSIGLHPQPSLENNLQEAIKIADKMLYIAKKDGRNKVVSYNQDIHHYLSSKQSIESVKSALDEDRIICFYQPIYNYKDKKIIKYEALVRMKDKDDNIISPMEFLPQLKHTNLHYKLTQRILSVVFDKFRNSDKAVSININFSDLIHPDIEERIIKELKTNPYLASRITFEILESDEIKDIKLFKRKIDLLQSLHAKVSIDDFGSGYSNFKATIDIEANFLKIDGSLVRNIADNEKDYKVVESILHFAKQANMQTIAEFVHSEAIYNKLMELNVDFMQGYFISPPLSYLIKEEELFEEYLKELLK